VGGPANDVYQSAAGSYTLVASGIDGSGLTACHQTGSHTFTVPKAEDWMRIDGSGASYDAPYTCTSQVFSVPRTMTATRVGCPEGAKDYEGTTFQTGLYSPFQPVLARTSADGRQYVGSEDQTSADRASSSAGRCRAPSRGYYESGSGVGTDAARVAAA
jgi:hypothetical protein